MLLTLTNPVENITHVTLTACEENDPDEINSTAKVFYLYLIASIDTQEQQLARN